MRRGLLCAALTASVLMLICSAKTQAQATAQPVSEQSLKDDNEARDLFKRGKEAFDEGRFERALMYFKDAYELSHRAVLLSNIGATLDRLRRDSEALEVYRQYLAEVADAPNRAFVQERVRIIEGARAKASQSSATEQPGSSAQGTTQPAVATSAPIAPTPQEAAQAAVASAHDTPRAPAADSGDAKPASSDGIASRWWFWAGIGAAAAAAVVVGVSVGSAAGTRSESPAVSNPDAHIRTL